GDYEQQRPDSSRFCSNELRAFANAPDDHINLSRDCFRSAMLPHAKFTALIIDARLSAVRALHLDVARWIRHKGCLLRAAAYNGRRHGSKVLGGTLGLFCVANRIRKLESKNHRRSANGRRLG